MLVNYLRRPIILLGIFLAASVLVVATAPQSQTATARSEDKPVASEAGASQNEPEAASTGLPENGSARALVERGARAFELGRYDDAIAYLRAAIRKEPRAAVAHNMLGMAYRYRYSALRSPGDREREIEAFRTAATLDPRYVAALVNLGVSLHQTGQKDEAVRVLTRALELEPNHPEAIWLSRLAGLQP
jgi:tetratricopeptide (TPR) repeat protein